MGAEHIKLPDVIDIASAQDLKSEFLRSYQNGMALDLDASKVERIGTPGLQLLWSAMVSYGASGMELRVSNPSAAFVDAFEDAGLNFSKSFRVEPGTV